MTQRTPKRPTWAACAWDKSPGNRGAKLLHKTYVRASDVERAKASGREALKLFVRGRRFHLSVHKATPQELGCVPAGSGWLSQEVAPC